MAKVSSFLDSAGSSTSLSSNMPWIVHNLIIRLLMIVRIHTHFNMVIGQHVATKVAWDFKPLLAGCNTNKPMVPFLIRRITRS